MPKPSFRCWECARRKVLCDERRGGCLRCERYGVICPGYPDPFDVVLRHRSKWEVAIDQLASGFALPQNRPRPANSSHRSEASVSYVQQPSMDFEEMALGAFYSSYCVSSSTICPIDYIRAQGNGCLWAALKMLGMMQLNHTWLVPDGRQQLLRQYSKATALLNAALSSPAEFRADPTLLATLTLSIAEMKQSPDFSLDYWAAHTRGAAALMELRGAQQTDHQIGSALFLQTSSQIVIESVLGRRHIPGALEQLRLDMHPYIIDSEHPLWQWHGVMYRVANFWANASQTIARTELSVEHAHPLIDEARSIHEEMQAIFDNAGAYWKFDVRPSDRFLPLIGHEHIYPSLLTARVWNDRRTATILLFTAVLQVTELCPAVGDMWLTYDGHPQKLKSYALATIQDTAQEILAAIPQMIAGLKVKVNGALHIRTPSLVSKIRESSNDLDAQGLRLCESSSEYDERVFVQQSGSNVPSTSLPYMDTCRVQWPVYFAVQCEFVASRIRPYLLAVLDNAAEVLRIQQFKILAERVRPNVMEAVGSLEEAVERA